MNRLPAGPQPDSANRRRHADQRHVYGAQPALPPTLVVASPVHEQPQYTADPVREPAGEEGGDEGEEVVEVRDRLGDYPRGEPEEEGRAGPDADGEGGVGGEVGGAAEEADVDVFCGDVAVDDACYYYRGEGDLWGWLGRVFGEGNPFFLTGGD